MSIKNSKAKPAKTIQMKPLNEDITIQLTDASFGIVSAAFQKQNFHKHEAEKANQEAINHLTVISETAGYAAADHVLKTFDADNKALILTKKPTE